MQELGRIPLSELIRGLNLPKQPVKELPPHRRPKNPESVAKAAEAKRARGLFNNQGRLLNLLSGKTQAFEITFSQLEDQAKINPKSARLVIQSITGVDTKTIPGDNRKTKILVFTDPEDIIRQLKAKREIFLAKTKAALEPTKSNIPEQPEKKVGAYGLLPEDLDSIRQVAKKYPKGTFSFEQLRLKTRGKSAQRALGTLKKLREQNYLTNNEGLIVLNEDFLNEIKALDSKAA